MTTRLDMSFSHLVPSDDWELNLLLLKIAQQLDNSELEGLKFLCTGSKGVPKRVLSQLSSPEMFFTYLREQTMISRDNLLLLQAFLWHLERKDLHELAAEYARRIGNTLYFYAPKEKPENGFKHIQFHVEGNLDRFQRSDLEALRATMARLLFVPQEFIFLSGVEPNSSLTLTFMIHEQCVDPLKDLFKEHSDSFGQLGVDGISVGGLEYIDPSLADWNQTSGAKGHAWTDAGDIDWNQTSGAKGHAWTDSGDIDWNQTSGAKGHAWTDSGDMDWDQTSGAKGHAWTDAGDIDWDQTSGAKGHAWTDAGDIDWDQISGEKGHAWTGAGDIDWDHTSGAKGHAWTGAGDMDWDHTSGAKGHA
ncbi:hypothetical protein RRG08_002655 [Elysia crispata]|uniref:DED domain-containing protein n=1 Tax=Elysia crispata TaxID=231223 RepID=A0AAE0XTU5_9GAST|nr:hypothetical protein RRG08_002655 [Elysia crispata]